MKKVKTVSTVLFATSALLLTGCSSGFTDQDKIILQSNQDFAGTIKFDESPSGIALYEVENGHSDSRWIGVGINNSDGTHRVTISSLELTDKDGKTWTCPELSSFIYDWKGAYSREQFSLGETIRKNEDKLRDIYSPGEMGTSYVLCDQDMPTEFESGKLVGFNNEEMATLETE